MNSTIRSTQTTLADVTDELRDEWEALADLVGANYTLYPAWTVVVAKSHSVLEQTRIFTAHDGANLVALFPIVSTHSRSLGMRLRRLDVIANLVSYHHQPLSSLNPRQTLDLLLAAGERLRADVLYLAQIPDESEIGRHLQHGMDSRYKARPLPSEVSPYLPLDGSWENLLASKPKKFRYKARKRSELLNSSSDLRMQWYATADDWQKLLDCMQIVEGNSWKKTAGSSIFDSTHERRYHELLLPLLADKNAMFANVLFRCGTPIAFNLCCIWNRWVGQMKTSFDHQYADLSPGSIVIDHAIRRAIELGATEFDFLGDSDPHKLAWTKQTRSHTNYYLYLTNSLKGRTVGYLKKLRAASRKGHAPRP